MTFATSENSDFETAATGAFGNIKGLSYYAAGKEDPYVTLSNPNQEDAELEQEELEILPTDNLVVSAKTADEVPLLEVHVYENPDAAPASSSSQDYEGNLYVHHDTLMPAMALCLEWGDVRPSTSAQKAQGDKGNFVAVGTMDHQIEIWDLDLVDGLIPEVILGDDSDLPPIQEQEESKPAVEQADGDMEVDGSAAIANGMADVDLSSTGDKKKKKKKKKSKTVKPALSASQPAASTSSPYVHTDSVLALAWNRTHRNLLASSSADGTIKLWDVSSPTAQRALRSFSLHTKSDKIQALQWNPKEPTVLIAGSWKGEIKIFDTRSPENALTVVLPNNADVEVLRWDPLSTTGAEFYVASGSGQVLYYDSKDLSKPVWTLDAHQGPTAALDINPFIPGCFVTGGIDKQVKVWNVSSASGSAGRSISLVVSRDFSLGKVFSCLWSPDDPTILAMGGSNAKLNIWDTWTNPGFRKTFGERVKQLNRESFKEGSAREKAKGITQIEDDQDEMSGDE